jgi:glycolate oxidase iron-sulfur subunit
MFNFTETSDACIKCGKCIPVCTIHRVNPDETTSPRGFIDLLGAYQRGQLPLDKTAKDIFESCFLCTHCVDVCPNSLPTDMVIEQVRYDLAQQYGIAWWKRIAFWLLEHRKVMDWVMKLGFMFKTCALAEDEKGRGLKARFSMPLVKKGRLLPSMAKRSFLNSYPERVAPEGEAEQKVAVFIGCLANYNYTGIGDSLMRILQRLNIEAVIPKSQQCCGAPAYFTGAHDSVERMTKKNIELFERLIEEEKIDAILIPEATCSAMVVHDWAVFFKNRNMPEWEARAKEVAKKVHMATEWLYAHTQLEKLLQEKGAKIDATVTYHDPCHARKVQGIYKEPRALLAPNYTLKEMSEPDRCCGFGGVTMQTEKFYLAEAAGKPKAAMIEQTGAQFVSAECSACRVQIGEALNRAESDVIFKNPLELIAEALEG